MQKNVVVMTQNFTDARPFRGGLRPLRTLCDIHLPFCTETRLGRRDFIASVLQIERHDTRKNASNVAQCLSVLPECW